MSKSQEKKKTVLIVDDDVDFLTQQKILLDAEGFEVITAEGQQRAEAVLTECVPDLVVLDLMMENADGGFVLCHHIKRDHPEVPVIIVTSVTSETGIDFTPRTPEERSWVKADAMLSKPIRFEQLKREIDRLVV